MTTLNHSSDISKEQHMKLLPFLAFEREKIDCISYDCEKTIAEFDRVPDNRFAYGIVKITIIYTNLSSLPKNTHTLSK